MKVMPIFPLARGTPGQQISFAENSDFSSSAMPASVRSHSASRCASRRCLAGYDVNSAGQVHTYLGYLRDLPYQEQLYWASMNEWPKAPISRRAFQTDFRGEFATDYDPLIALKGKVKRLDELAPKWWNCRGKAAAPRLMGPYCCSIYLY